jgi:hypothetical protein
MQIRPERHSADVLHGVENVVVIVPVDADINEAQRVAQERRQDRLQRGQLRGLRGLHFQHHDRDDDREHAVAERFQPAFIHACFSISLAARN